MFFFLSLSLSVCTLNVFSASESQIHETGDVALPVSPLRYFFPTGKRGRFNKRSGNIAVSCKLEQIEARVAYFSGQLDRQTILFEIFSFACRHSAEDKIQTRQLASVDGAQYLDGFLWSMGIGWHASRILSQGGGDFSSYPLGFESCSFSGRYFVVTVYGQAWK